MSFSVRRVEDPAIYVRRNKPDIFGIGNAWDNIVNFKDALNRLEDNIDAADRAVRQKPGKKASPLPGPVLKEISSETQHLGKVTRFQLLGENHSFKSLPKHSVPSVEIKTRRNDGDKAIPYISDISSINRETYSQSSQARNGYSPSRYAVSGSKSERPSFFTTTTVNPVILNDTASDLNQNKESSFTTVNSSINSQQFSLSTSPTFHGKAVLAKNGAALQKIKERVQKQKAMLSKQDEEVSNDAAGDRKLHDSKEKIEILSESGEKKEIIKVPLKRKVGAISSSGPTYRGFNPVSTQKGKKCDKRKTQQSTNKTSYGTMNKGSSKPPTKPEPKLKKAPAKMKRIISSKCPTEVISTTSWREGQATVKKLLNAKKVKPAALSVMSPTEDELSEGKLSSDENELFEMITPQAKRLETEKDIPRLDEAEKVSDNKSQDSDMENDERFKDVLSTEAQSMLAELAQDDSESEMKEERPTGPSRKAPRGRKAVKPVAEEKYPKEKSRHYDQTEVQKYMAQQMAERKKKLKQEKIQKKKQEDEKQRRLKDLYERQKKSFALPKKEKHLGETFSCDIDAVHIPGHGSSPVSNEEQYSRTEHTSSQNESDKENTDVDEIERSSPTTSFDNDSDEDINSSEVVHETSEPRLYTGIIFNQPIKQAPLDKRAQRLSALQATALALQSRLQSQALRLGSVNEEIVSQPAATRAVAWEEKETEFQGILPGVTNIRKHADENEKHLAQVEAATKIQAAYRGHNVRKRFQWKDENATSDENSVVSSLPGHSDDMVIVEENDEKLGESSINDGHVEYPAVRPLYNVDHTNHALQLDDLRFERNRFFHADAPAVLPSTRFFIPSVPFEPRGDRFSVMNIFSRRHPTVTVEEMLNEQPGSETASLLDVEGKPETKDEYEDDFTDEDLSTTSALTEGDLRKESPVVSKGETYSECFESEEELQHESEEKESTIKDEQEKLPSPLHVSPTIEDITPERNNAGIIPVMTSTMHPEPHPSPSLSDDSDHVTRHVFIKPVSRAGGNRLSPDSLQRKLTAEINLLENVEDSVRQVNDIEKTRVVSLAQQETVSLAQILKAKQQNHDQEMQNLRLKAKDEAIQAAKDLEKTRQAGSLAAASAAKTLAEIHSQVLKTNSESSKKYVEEASKMASSVLSDTTKQLAEFCKNVTATTSSAVEQLHKIERPTTTYVERATSYSEGHAIHSDIESRSGDQTRTSDVYSNQSKSWETSPSVTSGHQQGPYSSDDFESYKSRTNAKEESEIKSEQTRSASLSVESIPEDLPDKSVTDDDTTINDDDTTINEESLNDSRSVSTEKLKRSEKAHGAVSPFLDYSSQFEDSSHVPTDDDIDFRLLLPSREHRRKSIKRIKDDSFDEEKGKERSFRTPFESDDSFGKFTADMIQQYMKKEEVRTKHQSAILRLREKSLKEKTKGELQWIEQMKKQSRNKGSDDVMPSIKKRERGILMKLKAEKEEIKSLKAANKAASFQRRFMIYQQQEITRLHLATLNIRERIQGDTSKKRSNEPLIGQPKTSSPIKGTATSSIQTSPSNNLSDAKKSSKASFVSSPSAKSVSEDISEEHGTSRVSPAITASPFPSYSTPESGLPEEQAASQPRETSNILDMLSFVGSGEPELSDQNGERLLKIQQMLVERQQKLAKDESEVNSMLQKVTELIHNQKNNIATQISQENNNRAESVRTPSSISEVRGSEKSRSESSIPEDLASVDQTTNEEVQVTPEKTSVKEMRDMSEKTPSEYTNCTFESDTTPSKSNTAPQASTQVEDEHSSLTETSDHSDYEERIKKLKEEIQREKMKADALEKKKRKMKRSAMKKEVLTLEKELKNTKEDIQRKMVEIRTASSLPHVASPLITPPSMKIDVSSTKERPWLLRQRSDHSVSVNEAGQISESKQGKMFENSDHEVEESFIEILDGRVTSLRDKSDAGSLSEEADIPEEISEHLDSERQQSIPKEMDTVEKDLLSKTSNTEPDSTPEGSPIISVQSLRSSPDETPEIIEEVLDDTYTESRSNASVPEDLQDSHERSPGIIERSPDTTEYVKEDRGETTKDLDEEYSYTEPRSSTSVSDSSRSEGLPEDIPDGEKDENVAEKNEQASDVSDISENLPEDISEKSNVSGDLKDSENIAEVSGEKDLEEISEIFDISENSPENGEHLSEKSNVSGEKVVKEFPSLKDSKNIAEVSGEKDLEEISETSDISENLSEDQDDVSENSNVSGEKALKEFPSLKDSENHVEVSGQKDFHEISDIFDNFPEDEEHISDNMAAEKTPDESPHTFKDSDSPFKISAMDTEEIRDLRMPAFSHDVDTSEKITPMVPEPSNQIAGMEGETPSMKHLERDDVKENGGKSRSQTSSIAKEIPSAYDDNFSDFGSFNEESKKLMFVDTEKVKKGETEEKHGYDWDSSDASTHTSAGNEEIVTGVEDAVPSSSVGGNNKGNDSSEKSTKCIVVQNKEEPSRSESSKSGKVDVVERQDTASQEEQYSEDFEDDETESDIPEMLDEEIEEEDEEEDRSFKTFDDKAIAQEEDGSFKIFDDKAIEREETEEKGDEEEDLFDDITDDIYREIMDDSFERVSGKSSNEDEKGEKTSRGSKVDTEGITKDLLAGAILQMMEIKRRRNVSQEEAKSATTLLDLHTVVKPPAKSLGYETPTGESSLGAGLGMIDEQKAVSNALLIAKSNQALNEDALKEMDHDIEGLLGTPVDDEDDECEFQVNENKFTDIPSDDTEPSVHDYSPMFAVPHNVTEVASIVDSTVDTLLVMKRDGLPLDSCKPTAQLLGGETENDFENRSTRSYRSLVFDLTQEVFIDAVSQNEMTSRPPWAKAKWKGGQKLSRNFLRCKSDDEIRALVQERVTHTIGLGAPRTTMQTLQRKTPVRGNKKDNVDAILIEELRQEEPQWTDYDEDETAVKFQVADSILNMLLDDTVRVFNAIEAKKNVPDNVVVI